MIQIKPLAASAVLLAVFGLAGASQAAVVITSYDFNNANGIASTVDDDVVASAVTAGPNANNNLVFSNNQARITNSDYEEAKATALSTGQYITFTVTADPGTTLNLTQLSYQHSRTSSAPRRLAVFASADGGSFNQIDDFGNGNSSNLATRNPDLTGGTYDGIGEVEFRFVFYDDNSSPGLARFDNFILSGEVIPEPASLALLGLGGLCLLGGRRRDA